MQGRPVDCGFRCWRTTLTLAGTLSWTLAFVCWKPLSGIVWEGAPRWRSYQEASILADPRSWRCNWHKVCRQGHWWSWGHWRNTVWNNLLALVMKIMATGGVLASDDTCKTAVCGNGADRVTFDYTKHKTIWLACSLPPRCQQSQHLPPCFAKPREYLEDHPLALGDLCLYFFACLVGSQFVLGSVIL